MKNEEINQEKKYDVANTVVNISDTTTPIVIPFGPASAGKTMVLLRMIRYFDSIGYKFKPDRLFRPGDDIKYQNLCDEFSNERPFADYTPGGNADIDFLLVTIRNERGRSLFQFLEAPGEHFFDGQQVKNDFPPYIENIIGQNTPKTWLVLLQLDWGNSQSVRNMYKQQILVLKAKMQPDDRIVFLFNKADNRPDLFDNSKPDMDLFIREINNQYPNLLNQFAVKGFLNKMIFGNVPTLCFSAGGFSKNSMTGKEMWICKPQDDWYCEELLKVLK